MYFFFGFQFEIKIKIKVKAERKRRFYWKVNRSFSALSFVKDDRSIPEYLNLNLNLNSYFVLAACLLMPPLLKMP